LKISEDELSEIDVDEVTSISYSTNYTRTYERYFNRELTTENEAVPNL